MTLKQRLADMPYTAIWDAIGTCNRSVGLTPRPISNIG